MSLLTRCPACSTIYKVVPDQLRISQGWVKCGQCGDIFDATQHLVHIEQEAPPTEVDEGKPAEAPPLDAQETVDQPESEAQPDVDVLTEGAVQMHAAVAEVEQSLGVQQSAPADNSAPSTHEHDDPALTDLAQQIDSGVDDVILASAVSPEPAGVDQNTPQTAPPMEEPSFMRAARRSRYWRNPWVRAVLLVLAIVLLLTLMAQGIYRERQFLSASHPQWTPALQTFCVMFDCQVEALQRIEAVAIDAASFNKTDDARYHLSFVLKNSAEVPLAVPNIELTLTDLQERVVVRRVFSARELDGTIDRLRPAADWQVNVALELDGDKLAQRVVGYRVRAFYP